MIGFRCNYVSLCVFLISLDSSAIAFNVGSQPKPSLRTALQASFFEALINPKSESRRSTPAKDLVKMLVEENKCFSTEAGATSFGAVCAEDVLYEDCFEPEPFVGKNVGR